MDGANNSEIRVKNCSAEIAKLCSSEDGRSEDPADTSTETTTDKGTSGSDSGSNEKVTGNIEEGEGATLNEVVTRIEVSATVDHDSFIVISGNEVYWRHVKLGIPQSTTVKFYGAKGLINKKSWTPKFKDGRGPDCDGKLTMRATLYCEKDCHCWSEKIKFGKGHKLSGTVGNFSGRGQKQITGDIEIRLYDPQPSQSDYSFSIE